MGGLALGWDGTRVGCLALGWDGTHSDLGLDRGGGWVREAGGMRYAISTSPQRTTWNWMLEAWQRADAIDAFESGWTFDHFYPLFGDSTEDCLEGWMTLAALLHETRRLRGGVLVSGMIYRHPALLAHMATTLDITSGGRVELGVGAGWNEEECEAFGIELGSLTERFDRFEEGLAVIDGMLTAERTTVHGQYYTVTEAMNNPKPVQRPLPICIGGRGLRRTMPLVARYAHHWNYGGGDPAEFTRCRDVIHEHCAALGRDPQEITCSVLARWAGDPKRFRDDAAAFGDVGADLALVALPKDVAGAAAVEEVAAAIEV